MAQGTTKIARSKPPGILLGGDLGFQYFKYRHDTAENAEKSIFQITQWNYFALSALGLITGTSFITTTLDRSFLIAAIGMLITAISVGATALAYLYYKYSVMAFKIAWIAEKGYLRNKDGRILVDQHLRRKEFVTEYKDSGVIRLTRKELKRFLYCTFVWINLVPALAGFLLVCASPFASSEPIARATATRTPQSP